MRPQEQVKQFMMTSLLIEDSLDKVEAREQVDLKRKRTTEDSVDDDYYPQIEAEFRAEAARMSPHYEVMYSLEKSIRSLVHDTITAAENSDWWNTSNRVPTKIKSDAEARRQKELDSPMTLRSDSLLDFTTFGELGEIIRSNWNLFGGMFSSQKALEKVMASLNSLRAPIAHCCPLAEDEVVRLRLAIKDWFRLMD